MYEVLAGTDVSALVDVKIVLRDDSVIRIESAGLFADVVRNSDGQFLPVHMVPDDCEIIATITPPGGVQSDSEGAS
jgi:hypothetical protein